MKPPAVHWHVNDPGRHGAQCGARPHKPYRDYVTADPVRVTCHRCWRFVRWWAGNRFRREARRRFASVIDRDAGRARESLLRKRGMIRRQPGRP